MLAIWRGGIWLLGGIAGAIVINIPRMRRYGYRFFQVVDPARSRWRSASRSGGSAT